MIPDPYKILQVDPEADLEIIKAAYRRLSLKWHPDTNDSPEAEERFKAIAAAYAFLMDPARRLEYDRQRKAEAQAKAQHEQGHVGGQRQTPMSDYQKQSGQSFYGQSPYAQPPAGTPGPAGQSGRPKEVEISFSLWISIFMWAAIEGLIDITTGYFQRSDDFALALTFLFLLIFFVCSILMRWGRNWARITLGILGSYLVLIEFFKPSSSGAPWILQQLLVSAAVVTMFTPAASDWFRHLT